MQEEASVAESEVASLSQALELQAAQPGICSNDKTKACAVAADCGTAAGITCYLPTAGGQTLTDQVCMADAAGFDLTCTANDISVARTSSLVIEKGCDFPGDTATFSFIAEFLLTAQDRYDLGAWIAEDGGDALTGSCSASNLPISPTPPWTNSDATAQPTDTCGDITADNNPVYSSIQSISARCVDVNADGFLDVNVCLSWRQSGANDVCTSPLDAFPGAPSKCKCQALPGINIPVPGQIIVDKVTDPAADPTSFDFTLAGGPESINVPFSLTDASEPFESAGLPLGTYSVTELVPNGWELTGASCTSDQPDRAPTPSSIVLHSGETVTCVFNDHKLTEPPSLTVTKDNDADHDGVFSDTESVPTNAAYPWTVTYRLSIANGAASPATIDSILDDKTSTLTAPVSGRTPTCASLVGSSIEANATLVCYFDVTFANANLGQVINTATVAASNSAGSDSASDTSTVNFGQDPRISLEKSTPVTSYDAVGDVISYSLVATNTGNVTLTSVTISDPKLGALTCVPVQPATLAPGASISCSGSYTVAQGDLDAGKVDNTATASGNPPTGPAVTDTDSESVPAQQSPAIALDKSTTVTLYDSVGDVIPYTLIATNTGNVALTGVTVVDPLLGSLSCSPAQPAILAPGASINCTGSYTVTQADLDAGKVDNTATASGTPPTGPAVSDTDSESVPAQQSAAIALDKSTTATSYGAVGEVIPYTLVATNTGNVSLSAVTVVDAALGSLSCTPAQPATLLPGANMTCTGSHTVTQSDLDAGSFPNTANASGTPPTGPAVTASDSVNVPALQSPAIALDKSTTATGYDAVGDVIPYTLVATNTGNVTLTGVTVVDPLLGSLSCSPTQPAILVPGGVMSCTGSHTVTQADLDAGFYANTATASGTPPTGPAVTASDSVNVPAQQLPAIALEKSTTATGYDAVGDVIPYTLVATNTGNVTLSGVVIVDPLLGSLACSPAQPAILAPGAAMTCTGSHTVTQADLDAGLYANTATASGTPPTGPAVSDTDSESVPAQQRPAIALEKSSTATSFDAVGDVLPYTLVATNTGNVTLTGVVIVDPLLGSLGCSPAQPAILAPGASLSCTGSHTVTQADLDAGHYANASSASGNPPSGPPVTDDDDVDVPASQLPSIALEKSTTVSSFDAVGDVLPYTLVATNTGNVTLTAVTISDPLLGSLACTPLQPATLAPGESLTCTGSHTVTQADLDAGHYANASSASGNPPSGPPVTDDDDVDVPADQRPAIDLDKSTTSTGFGAAGDVIPYTLVATNTGNVTLSNVTIVDPMLGALSCVPAQPATLAPGAALTCTGSYTAAQADVDAGFVANTATASGTPPSGTPVNDFDSENVPALQVPAIALAKVATVASYDAVGDVLAYTLVATNTGNVTLSNVTITDPKLGALTCLQPAILQPGASLTCTGSYTVTQADVDAGSVYNLASVSGLAPSGAEVTAQDDETVPALQVPAISLDKSTTAANYDAVGDVIPYTLVATNTGNVTLTAVAITDAKLGALSCTPLQPATLLPGATLSCTGSYTVSQADLDAGSVANTANAAGTPPTGPAVTASDSALVPALQSPALSLAKSANPTTYTLAGDVIVYTYVVSNSGNVTLAGPINVSDDRLGSFACGSVTTFAPGASVTCTRSYTIVAADVLPTYDNVITNHATATATFGSATVTSNEAQATIRQAPPSAQIAPTQVTCSQFAAGTAPVLTTEWYTVRKNAINSVAPGVLFYYSRITAPSSAFTLQVAQSNDGGFPAIPIQDLGQVVLYSDACSKSPAQGTTTYDAASGLVTVQVQGAFAGQVFYVGIKYSPSGLAGIAVARPYPTVNYRFQTAIDAAPLLSSRASFALTPKK